MSWSSKISDLGLMQQPVGNKVFCLFLAGGFNILYDRIDDEMDERMNASRMDG